MTNYDRSIRQVEAKLAAVERREGWALTGSEKARLTRALASGGYKAARGKSTSRADRVIEDIWATAAQRLRADIEALKQTKAKSLQERAEARASRRGWR